MVLQYDLSKGSGERANVEFVSAYPSRGLRAEDAYAAFTGDMLANLLADAGWAVTREYYVNDSGPQADALARSVFARLRNPEDFEHTDAISEALRTQIEPGLLDAGESTWLPELRSAAIMAGMEAIKADLVRLAVRFDVFTHDSEVKADETLPQYLKDFAAKGLLFGEDGAQLKSAPVAPKARLFLDTPAYGDTRRRPLTGAEGRYTYFAYDLSYHAHKMARGFPLLLDVFRKDYGSYGQGLAAGVSIMSGGEVQLETSLIEPVIAPRIEDDAPRGGQRNEVPDLEALLAFYGPSLLRRLFLGHGSGVPLELACDGVIRRALSDAAERLEAALALPAAPQPEALLSRYETAHAASLSGKSAQPILAYADTLAAALLGAGAASDIAKARLAQCKGLLGL